MKEDAVSEGQFFRDLGFIMAMALTGAKGISVDLTEIVALTCDRLETYAKEREDDWAKRKRAAE